MFPRIGTFCDRWGGLFFTCVIHGFVVVAAAILPHKAMAKENGGKQSHVETMRLASRA